MHWRFQALIDTYPDSEPLTATGLRNWCAGVEHAIRDVLGTDSGPYENIKRVTGEMMFGDDFEMGRQPPAELLQQMRSTVDLTLHTAAAVEDDNRTQLRVVDLHPWIAEVAEPLFDGGKYHDAILAAARNLELKWKALLEVEGYTLSTLADESFSKNAPSPGHPRLRYPAAGTDTGSSAWKNAHGGARDYAKGCAKRIRNLGQHHAEKSEREPSHTMEVLSALSVLARWVTEAELHTGEPA